MADQQSGMRADERRMAVLTSPGGAFPLVERLVDGVPMEFFDRDPYTLRDAFLATRGHGDRLALVYEDERYTYADQWRIVVTLAHALQGRLGVGPGDRVAVAMRNYPDFVFWFWAAQLVGGVVVPLNAWLTGPELEPLLDAARPAVLVADRERVERLRGVDLAARDVRTVVGVRCEESGSWPGTEWLDGADLLTHPEDAELPEPPAAEIRPSDPATILFTSGTTGPPKAVAGTHLNHSASLLNKLIRAVPLSADGRSAAPVPPSTRLLTFPFFHIAGISNLYTAAYSGHLLVLMYKWDTREALRLIEVEGVRELAGPPFVVQTFLDAARTTGRDLSSLRSMGMGGSAAPTHLIQAVHELFGGTVTPRTGYGLTETTSGVVSIAGAEFVAHPGSVGRPLPTVQVRIQDEHGHPLPPGTEGEVAIRGPQVVRGYLGDAASAAFAGGWFLSGDTGRIDDEGLLHLVGRLKDVVIRGGENINCSEVEGCLDAHPDVLESAAFGLPHPTLGEELVALVRLRPGSPADGAALRDHVAARLAAFKTPARVLLSDDPLPRTASGKLLKRGLPAQLATSGRPDGTVATGGPAQGTGTAVK